LLFPEAQRSGRRRRLSPSPTRAHAKRASREKAAKESKGKADDWSEDDDELKLEPPKKL